MVVIFFLAFIWAVRLYWSKVVTIIIHFNNI